MISRLLLTGLGWGVLAVGFFLGAELPVLELGSLLSLADLGADLVRLVVGEPARIGVATLTGLAAQHDGVEAVIAGARGGICTAALGRLAEISIPAATRQRLSPAAE